MLYVYIIHLKIQQSIGIWENNYYFRVNQLQNSGFDKQNLPCKHGHCKAQFASRKWAKAEFRFENRFNPPTLIAQEIIFHDLYDCKAIFWSVRRGGSVALLDCLKAVLTHRIPKDAMRQ